MLRRAENRLLSFAAKERGIHFSRLVVYSDDFCAAIQNNSVFEVLRKAKRSCKNERNKGFEHTGNIEKVTVVP